MTLPLGTIARVTSLDSGKTVKVRINDRGPRAHGRIIDLSAEAAAALDLHQDGVGPVKLEVFASDQ
jgi:rare lipoprotein A